MSDDQPEKNTNNVSFQQFPNIVITPLLKDKNNYREWATSVELKLRVYELWNVESKRPKENPGVLNCLYESLDSEVRKQTMNFGFSTGVKGWVVGPIVFSIHGF